MELYSATLVDMRQEDFKYQLSWNPSALAILYTTVRWIVDTGPTEVGPWSIQADSVIRSYLGDGYLTNIFFDELFRLNFTTPGQFVRVQEHTIAYNSSYLIVQIPFDTGIYKAIKNLVLISPQRGFPITGAWMGMSTIVCQC